MRILISAYACEPYKGSEQGVGWNWAKHLAGSQEVWVITRANNRRVIEEYLSNEPIPNIHFSYVDLPDVIRHLKSGEKGLYLYYFLWQIAAYARARSLHRVVHFDLTHHLTFGTNWMPTFLWLVPIPFVWGPIGGFETVPRPFRIQFSLKWRLYETLRDIVAKCALRVEPLSRMAAKKSAFIIARTSITYNSVAKNFPGKVERILETGIDRNNILKISGLGNRRSSKFQVLMVGRLIPWKGFGLGIEAFEKLLLQVPDAHLHVVGSGPERRRLEKLCENAQLREKVTLWGQLPHAEVMDFMSKADVLLYPSLKDAGAWVLFEALATGVPIVCFDNAGPGEVVTHECGIKVKPLSPAHAIDSIGNALLKIATQPDLRENLRKGSRERLLAFEWKHKIEKLISIYNQILR